MASRLLPDINMQDTQLNCGFSWNDLVQGKRFRPRVRTVTETGLVKLLIYRPLRMMRARALEEV
jgi:hypothetical protein